MGTEFETTPAWGHFGGVLGGVSLALKWPQAEATDKLATELDKQKKKGVGTP